METRKANVRCPICKKPVEASDHEFPFCSERCRTIDLGNWASGRYVISSPVRDTEDDFQSDSPPTDPDDE
jgi:uncharacterized protein